MKKLISQKKMQSIASKNKGPKSETITMLKMFARCYHAETALPESLQNLILN
jgi:hypothetical protein